MPERDETREPAPRRPRSTGEPVEVPAVAELLLSRQHTGYLATTDPAGTPHVVPVWFVWRSPVTYIASSAGSLKTRNVGSGCPAAFVVDEGQQTAPLVDGRLAIRFLRGVEIRGFLRPAPDDETLASVVGEWGDKYVENDLDVGPETLAGHVWLRLEAARFATWDYRR